MNPNCPRCRDVEIVLGEDNLHHCPKCKWLGWPEQAVGQANSMLWKKFSELTFRQKLDRVSNYFVVAIVFGCPISIIIVIGISLFWRY